MIHQKLRALSHGYQHSRNSLVRTNRLLTVFQGWQIVLVSHFAAFVLMFQNAFKPMSNTQRPLLHLLCLLLPAVCAANPASQAADAPIVTEAMRQEALKPTWVGDTDTLPPFPKPEPAKAFAELGQKIHQPDGSILRTPQEDWEGARKRMADDPYWTNWVQKKRNTIDNWMQRHHDRVQWRAGWWHDFVNPKDGAILVWTEEIPGEDVQVFRTLKGDEVELTPKLIASWVGQFRLKHTKNMAEAARLYRLTKEQRYLDWVVEQLDFYADNYEQWPLSWARKHPARLGIHCLDDAQLLCNMIEAARLVFDDVPAQKRQGWHKKLFAPQAEMLGESYHVIHNIAAWMRSAQAQVALLYDDEALWQSAVEAPYGLRDQLQRGITSDYFWYEQSMAYNSYVATAVLPTIVFAGLVGRGDDLIDEAAMVQNLLLSPLVIRFPDANRLPSPADTPGGAPRVPVSTLAAAARVIPTNIGVERAHLQPDWPTLIDPITQTPASQQPAGEQSSHSEQTAQSSLVEAPPVTSLNMESTRFAQLKQGPWQVFFHYGQVFRSHSQAEALNWSASFEETDVSHDPGTTGYGSKMTYGYFTRGLNHNVPLSGGEGQQNWNPGELLHFEPGDAQTPATATAKQQSYRDGIAAQRTLRIEGNTLIDETTLTRTAPGKPNSQWPAQRPDALPGLAFHIQGQPQLPDGFRPEPDFATDRAEAFSFWEDVRSVPLSGEVSIPIHFADGRVLNLEFICDQPLRLYQGSSPDHPPYCRSGFYLERETPLQVGEQLTFTTRLSPAENVPEE